MLESDDNDRKHPIKKSPTTGADRVRLIYALFFLASCRLGVSFLSGVSRISWEHSDAMPLVNSISLHIPRLLARSLSRSLFLSAPRVCTTPLGLYDATYLPICQTKTKQRDTHPALAWSRLALIQPPLANCVLSIDVIDRS
jgi:hypothetical protein